jgi:hypothetical protein
MAVESAGALDAAGANEAEGAALSCDGAFTIGGNASRAQAAIDDKATATIVPWRPRTHSSLL